MSDNVTGLLLPLGIIAVDLTQFKPPEDIMALL